MALAVGCSRQSNMPRGILVLPYVENLGSNHVVISWETKTPCRGALEFHSGADTMLVQEATSQSFHRVALSNLQSGVAYQYRLAVSNQPLSTVRTFSPDRAAYSFIVFGDNRKFVRTFERVVKAISPHPADFALHTGDCVTKGTTLPQWQREWFTPARPMLEQYPVLISWGNHEEPWKTNSGVHRYYPAHSPLWGNAYYAFQHGPVLFVTLNPYEPTNDKSEQYIWLEHTLASNTLPYVVVFTHPSAMTGSEHAYDADTKTIRTMFVPLFVRHHVTVCFSAHDHMYARGEYGGVSFVTTAGAGAPFHKMDKVLHPFIQHQTNCYHYVVMDVSAQALSGSVYTVDGDIIDRCAFRPARQPAPPPADAVATFEPSALYPGTGSFTWVINVSSFVSHCVTGMVTVSPSAAWSVEPAPPFIFTVPPHKTRHTLTFRALPTTVSPKQPLDVSVCLGMITNNMHLILPCHQKTP